MSNFQLFLIPIVDDSFPPRNLGIFILVVPPFLVSPFLLVWNVPWFCIVVQWVLVALLKNVQGCLLPLGLAIEPRGI